MVIATTSGFPPPLQGLMWFDAILPRVETRGYNPIPLSGNFYRCKKNLYCPCFKPEPFTHNRHSGESRTRSAVFQAAGATLSAIQKYISG